jgi:hypothetical protein
MPNAVIPFTMGGSAAGLQKRVDPDAMDWAPTKDIWSTDPWIFRTEWTRRWKDYDGDLRMRDGRVWTGQHVPVWPLDFYPKQFGVFCRK